jgi:hypothetical protein
MRHPEEQMDRRWQTWVTSGIAAVIVLAALGGRMLPAEAGDQPRSFQTIQVGHLTLTSDPSGTLATLHVRTSIKVVCAVAYGETAAYGHLATTRSMDPSGTYEHTPVLTGLRPNTTYVYLIQGVGADGNLYRSPVYSFRTPVAAASMLGRDVAVGATVLQVSSAYSSDYAGKYAVDGNPATEWSSNGDGNHAFITIDLHHAVRVVAVAFRTRSMSDGTAITRTFSVTVDGKKTYGPFPVLSGSAANHVAFIGRVLRFNVVSSTGGNTGASEIAVYTGQ